MSQGVLIGGEADVSPRALGAPAHWLTLQPHQPPLHVIASLLMPSAVMCFYNISSISVPLFQNRCSCLKIPIKAAVSLLAGVAMFYMKSSTQIKKCLVKCVTYSGTKTKLLSHASVE